MRGCFPVKTAGLSPAASGAVVGRSPTGRDTILRMAESVHAPLLAFAPAAAEAPRHTFVVRVTHWLTTLCFLALLVSGIEILLSHPRFYWGEEGNVFTPALFTLPLPSSRGSVPTGYGFVLKDQNGWSRALHFQTGWLMVFTGLLYALHSLLTGHFRRSLLPARADRSWRFFADSVRRHWRFNGSSQTDAESYNLLQRLAYLAVIFGLFPLMIWTGLAMSPAFTSAFPAIVDIWGGFQSARTIHFFATLGLVVFVVVHVAMVGLAGFRPRIRSMITGRAAAPQEHR